MALKNIEEAIVDRIQRAVAKELKRLRGRTRVGNGKAASRVLVRRAETMAKDVAIPDIGGGHA